MKSLGDVLRSARQEKGMRLSDVHKATGLSMMYISEIETDKKMPLKGDSIAVLAKFYGLDPDDMTFRALVQKFQENAILKEDIDDEQLKVARRLATKKITPEVIFQIEELLKLY